jgi:hypothetical protein
LRFALVVVVVVVREPDADGKWGRLDGHKSLATEAITTQ